MQLSPLRSGLVSVTFRKLSPKRIVELVAEAGLSTIEWGGDVHVPPGDEVQAETVRRLTEDAGLSVAAYGSYYSAVHSTAGDINGVLKTAKALGAPTVRVWAGKRGSSDADGDHVRHVTEDLQRVADAAAALGLTITIEYHGGTLTDTLDTTAALLDGVSRSNVRSGWQPRDGMTADHGVAEIKRLAPWLGNLHVFQWWPTGRERHPLVDGAERWPAFLEAAAAVGPRDVLIEFVKGDDPAQFLADAATVKSWIASLGS